MNFEVSKSGSKDTDLKKLNRGYAHFESIEKVAKSCIKSDYRKSEGKY
jgi:hypothetical protein